MGLKGSLTVPGDKSISHRTLILGSLAHARPHESTRIRGLLESGDVLATLGILRQLGVSIEKVSTNGAHEYRVTAPQQLQEASDILDASNSGTTMRLLSGLLSAQPFYSVLTGDEALRHRPMGRVIEPLRQMGARLYGRQNDTLAPLTLLPSMLPLKGIRYYSAHASAQVKSAILLAGLFAEGNTTVIEPVPSRDHTERMLSSLGVAIESLATSEGHQVTLTPGQRERIVPGDWQVPGDFSSAAFFLVAALLVPDSELCIKDVNLNLGRTGLLKVLQAVGADISVENPREACGEPMGDLVVRSSSLKGDVAIGGEDIPALIDEVPILMVAGACLEGTMTVTGAQELRKKESDRLSAMAEAFTTLGIEVSVFEDGFCITGRPDRISEGLKSPNSGVKSKSVCLSAHRDHRIAMALSVLNRAMHGCMTWRIEGVEWVSISYPGFFEQFAALESQSILNQAVIEE